MALLRSEPAARFKDVATSTLSVVNGTCGAGIKLWGLQPERSRTDLVSPPYSVTSLAVWLAGEFDPGGYSIQKAVQDIWLPIQTKLVASIHPCDAQGPVSTGRVQAHTPPLLLAAKYLPIHRFGVV